MPIWVMPPIMGREWEWPADPVSTDELISWTEVQLEHTQTRDHDEVLDDYCALAAAQPEEMAAFMVEWGVPRLRGTVPGDVDHSGKVPVGELRRHARAVGAVPPGRALAVRRPGDPNDWTEAAGIAPKSFTITPDADEIDDWKLGRENFDRLLTTFLVESRVSVRAIWRGSKALAIEPATPTLLGAIALLLAREVGVAGEYTCDNCERKVYRSREPREGESVYCDRPECKREQQRRNQAKWRAKKAAEKSGK